MRKNMAVECPRSGLIAVDDHVVAFTRRDIQRVQRQGAGSGQPSFANTVMCIPCKCIGWIIIPSFMKRMRTFWPSFATIGSVAGKLCR